MAKWILALTLIGTFAVSHDLYAQTPIKGSVKDENGSIVSGAEVVAKRVRNNEEIGTLDVSDGAGNFEIEVPDLNEPIILEFLPPANSNLAPSSLPLLSTEQPMPPLIELQNINKILQLGAGTTRAAYSLPDEDSGEPKEAKGRQFDEGMNDQTMKMMEFEQIYLRYLMSAELSEFDRRMLDYIREYMRGMPNIVEQFPRDECGKKVYYGNSAVRNAYTSKRNSVYDLFGVSDPTGSSEPKVQHSAPYRPLRSRIFRRRFR